MTFSKVFSAVGKPITDKLGGLVTHRWKLGKDRMLLCDRQNVDGRCSEDLWR